ncbi:hypothetical protein [Herbaspirillum rhizosphaerae]|uniref:hypothetical protein n=1 Tax=Herbaspirillum rhizosphaerae TaxID=346179 RepID=UPI0012EE7CC1|nr:hypothetical protein [Herbaspirillum rhizosphaerae]
MKNFIIAGFALLLFGLAGGVCATSPDAQETSPAVHIAPAIRSSALPAASAATISGRALLPLLRLPMVLDAVALASAPRIVAAPEKRAYLGKDDQMYVQGDLHGASEFRIVRAGRRLSDPASKESLGDEVIPLGKAVLQEQTADGLHRFLIMDATREIAIGDRLMAMPAEAPRAISPRRSLQAIDALIVSIADGADLAAQHQIVAINKGARDRLGEGELLSLSAAKTMSRTAQTLQLQQLPQEECGRLMIVRVFDRVSYGLIIQAREPVQVGDKAYAPQPEKANTRDVE